MANFTYKYENLSMDTELLIEQLNDEIAKLYLPVTIYIAVLLLLGLAGNMLVCYYYGAVGKNSASSVYIISLAVYDLLVCCVCMPTEITDIYFYYTFENDAACKVLKFLSYFSTIGSNFVLVAIARDRFKKICTLSDQQVTTKCARYTCVVCGLASAITSFPVLLLSQSTSIKIENKHGLDLQGLSCTTLYNAKYKVYIWVFLAILFIGFVLLSIYIITVYVNVSIKLYKHRATFGNYNLTPGNNEGNTNETSHTSVTRCTCEMQCLDDSKKNPPITIAPAKSGVPIINFNVVKITVLLGTVSLLFVLTHLTQFVIL